MFNDADRLAFKNFCQSITDNPRPIESQFNVRQDGFLWCDDWEIIELCKYFFNGHEGYLGDPPPNRLKKNPLWSKEKIVSFATALKDEFQTTEAIIEHLRKRRTGYASGV